MSALGLDRRAFLASSAASLVIGFRMPAMAQEPREAKRASAWELGTWVRIASDDTVTLFLSQSEIGQGISTTLPAILADELGADWNSVVVENAPVAAPYRNPRIKWMFTGNSESIQTYAGPMRQAGAAAREMLTEAAARRWSVDPSTCRANNGAIVHVPSGRRLRFGELVQVAATLALPSAPTLKPATEFNLIGREVPRRDLPSKVDGSAVFGLDFRVPGMVYAAVRLIPTFGGDVARFDPQSVSGMPGVIATAASRSSPNIFGRPGLQRKSSAWHSMMVPMRTCRLPRLRPSTARH
jgi:isoquinoline 1-oxidoreductase subunit beta